MSDSIEMTSCIRHKDTARYFIYYEDFQDLSKKHPDKLAAFLRVLEVKTNKRIASYAVLLEDAVNNNQPLPMLNLWHEVSYNDFVNWSLETLGRSSFQIADKVAEEMLLVRSKVLTRKLRPDDEHSPELTYKVYILVLENVQATIDGKEIPITGEAYENYGEEPPVIENIPLLKKTWGMLEKTRGDMLKKTAPPVEKNYFKDKNKDNTFKENNKEDTLASDDALSLLQEITNRFGGVEQVLSLLEKLSTQAQQLPTSNTQDKPTSTEADEQASYSHPATENLPPTLPNGKENNKRTKKDATQDLTLQGSHVIEVYEAFKKRKITRNTGNVKAANGLGEVVETDQDLNEVLTLMANDKFLKEHGVRIDLDFVYRKYDGFLDRVDKLREQAKKRTSGNNNYPDMSNASIEETDPYVLATMRSAGRLLATVN